MSEPTDKYWTMVVRYDVDGEPCDPPPHIQERLAMAMSVLHEIGFGMQVTYGLAERDFSDEIEIPED